MKHGGSQGHGSQEHSLSVYRVAGKGMLSISKICTESLVLGQIPESMVVARGMVCVEGWLDGACVPLTKFALSPGPRPTGLSRSVLRRTCGWGTLLASVCSEPPPAGGSIFMLGRGHGRGKWHLPALWF